VSGSGVPAPAPAPAPLEPRSDSELVETENYFLVFDSLEVTLFSFDLLYGWTLVTFNHTGKS
jgi:hypothetical protein